MIYVIFARVYTLCSCKSESFMSYMYALFRVKDKDCIVTKKGDLSNVCYLYYRKLRNSPY